MGRMQFVTPINILLTFSTQPIHHSKWKVLVTSYLSPAPWFCTLRCLPQQGFSNERIPNISYEMGCWRNHIVRFTFWGGPCNVLNMITVYLQVGRRCLVVCVPYCSASIWCCGLWVRDSARTPRSCGGETWRLPPLWQPNPATHHIGKKGLYVYFYLQTYIKVIVGNTDGRCFQVVDKVETS